MKPRRSSTILSRLEAAGVELVYHKCSVCNANKLVAAPTNTGAALLCLVCDDVEKIPKFQQPQEPTK